jgi:hypothetical protein
VSEASEGGNRVVTRRRCHAPHHEPTQGWGLTCTGPAVRSPSVTGPGPVDQRRLVCQRGGAITEGTSAVPDHPRGPWVVGPQFTFCSRHDWQRCPRNVTRFPTPILSVQRGTGVPEGRSEPTASGAGNRLLSVAGSRGGPTALATGTPERQADRSPITLTSPSRTLSMASVTSGTSGARSSRRVLRAATTTTPSPALSRFCW